MTPRTAWRRRRPPCGARDAALSRPRLADEVTSLMMRDPAPAIEALTDGISMDKSLDLRLIPEYDGTAKQSIAEWLEKVELVCKLRGIDNIAEVIPLRLTDGAFAVYLQLSDDERKSPPRLKDALLAAFAVDPYDAYEE
ncbi:hypothetical protein TTRE_0000786501, partial [Trichuris trichiura]